MTEAVPELRPLRIALEPAVRRTQDDEYCVVHHDGYWREIRFHDYADIYQIPGLYESLFHDLLECCSPQVVADLLFEVVDDLGGGELRALDLGAGNGLVGEAMRSRGAGGIVGVDILPEARDAAERDRSHVYDAYLVGDICELAASGVGGLRRGEFNALTCVAALGFGDIPPQAFQAAFDLLVEGALVAFNINERFLGRADRSGFAALVEELSSGGALKILRRRSYVHRLATNGDPIRYEAFVGIKTA